MNREGKITKTDIRQSGEVCKAILCPTPGLEDRIVVSSAFLVEGILIYASAVPMAGETATRRWWGWGLKGVIRTERH